jgi:Fe-S-cluster-containing hydrogenase component 2
MKATVYCTHLEPALRENVAAHIRSHWSERVVYDETDNVNISSDADPQAILLIRSEASSPPEIEAPLKETIVVQRTAAIEEILFLVDAKLGRLTKSDLVYAKREVPRKQVMSRREFFLAALRRNSLSSNDAPIVLGASCEAKFGCSKCVDACPAPGALKIENDSVTVSSEDCIRCGLCAGVCPVAAIQIPQFSENAYHGLLTATQSSSAPTKVLVITCDEQSVTARPWVDVEEVPGIGVIGVRQLALAANSSIDAVLVHCADGLCAAKANAKRAANQISSISGEDGPIVAYIEGKLDTEKINEIHKSARVCDTSFSPTGSAWKDYVKSLKSISRKQAQARGLNLTTMGVSDSCTLCYGCVESCPHRALAIHQDRLDFTSEECTGCGFCAKICPEQSISLSRMDGPIMLSTRTVYKDEMIQCTRCKTPYISMKMFKKVSGKIPGNEDVIRLCPKCRQTEIYEKLFNSHTPSSLRVTTLTRSAQAVMGDSL